MIEREVVQCSHGRVCASPTYGPDHHGWDCPLSDPAGDCIRALMDELPNPILNTNRLAFLAGFLPREGG